MIRLLFFGLLLGLGACSSADGNSDGGGTQPPLLAADQVETAQGIIQGAIEGSLVVFRGVRYAAPPVGDLRFKAPVPPAVFTGVRDALNFGANCIQIQGVGATTGEEDCLFLNIWSHNDDVVRPVMVNLHPGGANGVGGDLASIEPSEFSLAGDVVVVETDMGDAIAIRPVGILAHSFDHRAFDGAYSAAFLQRLKSIIEDSDWSSQF